MSIRCQAARARTVVDNPLKMDNPLEIDNPLEVAG